RQANWRSALPHGDDADFEEFPGSDHNLFTPNSNEPENRGERTCHGDWDPDRLRSGSRAPQCLFAARAESRHRSPDPRVDYSFRSRVTLPQELPPVAIDGEVCVSACIPRSPKRRRPAFCNSSTMTKSPATSGRTDQDTPFATFSRMLRSRHATTAIAKAAPQQVGAPSESPRAEDATSAAVAMANPTRASFLLLK